MDTFTIIPLKIEAKGEVISSNIDEFRELVKAALGTINRDLQTDEQFGQAELDAKALKEAEEAVKTAKDKALQDAESLHALFVAMDETSEEIRKARLELETQIKKRKEEIKTEIVEEFLEKFDIDPKDARRQFLTGLQTQIKGKRTVESMKTACRTYQSSQQAEIIKSRATIERFEAKFGKDLTMDRRELELKSPDSVEAELVRRMEAKKAAAEAAKLKAEADAAKASEAKAKAELAEANKPKEEPVKAGASSRMPMMAPAAAPAEAAPAVATEEAPGVDEEWNAFKASCLAAFGPIKIARDALKHSKNITKAQSFANAINSAWRDWS